MGKYLLLLEVDRTRIPIDPKERGAGWGLLMAMVRQDIEKGKRSQVQSSPFRVQRLRVVFLLLTFTNPEP